MLEGRTRAADSAQDGRAWLAHTIAVLARVKKLPKLKALLGARGRKARPQTWQEQLNIVRMMNTMLGGDVKTRGSDPA